MKVYLIFIFIKQKLQTNESKPLDKNASRAVFK